MRYCCLRSLCFFFIKDIMHFLPQWLKLFPSPIKFCPSRIILETAVLFNREECLPHHPPTSLKVQGLNPFLQEYHLMHGHLNQWLAFRAQLLAQFPANSKKLLPLPLLNTNAVMLFSERCIALAVKKEVYIPGHVIIVMNLWKGYEECYWNWIILYIIFFFF